MPPRGRPFPPGMVPYNRLPVDEHAFDTLDEERAWMLGFLFADCCVRIKDGYHALSLESVDLEVIERLQKLLITTHSIHSRQRGNGKKTYTIDLYGLRELGPLLENFGLKIGKSRRQPPEIPQRWVRDFIRGYFDGDGGVRAGRYKQSDIRGYLPLLTWIQSQVKLAGISGIVNNYDGCARLRFNKDDTRRLYEYMYTNAEVYLARKKVRFTEFRPRGGEVVGQ